MSAFLATRFAPFRHSNFRKFFLIQSFSLIGTWAHDLARSWIILNLIGNATSLGSMLLATALPGLFLSLHGGVLVDRYDSRRIMLSTKTVLAVSSLALAFFVEFKSIQMWQLLAYGILEGAIIAFDAPTFQALTLRLVPRSEIQQAIALNSTNFHVARMLGPVIGGVLLALHGPSLVFLFDSVTYMVLIFVLSQMRVPHLRKTMQNANVSTSHLLKEGVAYFVADKRLRYMGSQLMLTLCLAAPIMAVIFRSYLTKKFQLNGAQFGTLFMFPAIGSVIGALSFAAYKPKSPLKALRIGVPCAVIGALMVPYADSLLLAGLSMSLTGFGIYLSMASLTVSVQLQIHEEFTGRVSSIMGLGFNSISPLMAFPIGLFSDGIGARHAIYALALFFASSSAGLAWAYRREVKSHPLSPYDLDKQPLESPPISGRTCPTESGGNLPYEIHN